MIIIFIILTAGSIFGGNVLFQVAPLLFASIYGLTMALGAFTGGLELDREKLEQELDVKWFNAEEISKFIHKYWYSIRFAMSAQQRGANMSTIAMFSFFLAGYYFYKNVSLYLIVWSIANGLLLWVIGNKSNKALFYIRFFPASEQAKIASVSFIALSEILDNENFKFIASDFIPKETFLESINTYSKCPEEFIGES